MTIERALASGAHIILTDEPTSNLDEDNGEKVIEILAQLSHQQRYCIVVVTHILAKTNIMVKSGAFRMGF